MLFAKELKDYTMLIQQYNDYHVYYIVNILRLSFCIYIEVSVTWARVGSANPQDDALKDERAVVQQAMPPGDVDRV